VQSGFECGVVLKDYMDVKEGDQIEVFETRQVERTLS
jgi:translation initiation factor IF-2